MVIPKTRNGTNGNGITRNGTEKIGLKHGNGIFEHGTIKKRNKKFRLKCENGTIKTVPFRVLAR